MKKVIDGKLYDTATAELICSAGEDRPDNFDAVYEELYMTHAGRFFVVGSGYRSGYGRQEGDMTGYGRKLVAISTKEAKAFVEENASGDTYLNVFGEVEAA